VNILYGGELCALDGTHVLVKGSAGGVVENGTESTTFNKASFEATKTELKASAQPAEWTGFFPTEAFKAHREQKLEVA
jgi:hypothetical protein